MLDRGRAVRLYVDGVNVATHTLAGGAEPGARLPWLSRWLPGLALLGVLVAVDLLTLGLMRDGIAVASGLRLPAGASGPLIYLTPGLAVAALVRLGPAHAVWVAVASMSTSLLADRYLGVPGERAAGWVEPAVLALGDGLSALAAAWVIRRSLSRTEVLLPGPRWALALVVVGPGLSYAGLVLAARLGSGALPAEALLQRAPSWLAAEAAGNLMVVPLALLLGQAAQRERVSRQWAVLLGVLAGLALLCTWAAMPALARGAQPAIGLGPGSAPVVQVEARAGATEASAEAGNAGVQARAGGSDPDPTETSRVVAAWSRSLSIALALSLPLLVGLPLTLGAVGGALGASAGGAGLLLLASAAAGAGDPPEALVGWVGSLVAAATGLLLLGGAVEDRLAYTARLMRAQANLAQRRDRLRRLAFTMLGDQQALRARLATELHDLPLQDLAMAQMNLNAAAALLAEDGRGGDVATAQRSLTDAIASMREVLRELAPPVLVALGLFPAVRMLARRWEERDLLVTLKLPPQDPPRLNAAVEAFGLRVIDELIRNVAEHADATEATVVAGVNAADGELWIRVTDDGVGMTAAQVQVEALMQEDPLEPGGAGDAAANGDASGAEADAEPQAQPGLSLFAIREVIASLGGVMRLRNLERGVEVRLRIPAPLMQAESYGPPAGGAGRLGGAAGAPERGAA